MKAQTLYDLRQLTGYCSGSDLHEFFRQHTGNPSPGGDLEINSAEIPHEAIELLKNRNILLNAMREYGVSAEAQLQFALDSHRAVSVEESIRHARLRDGES